MRLFIYAQESSGASAFCHFLAQRPNSIAMVDVWSRNLTPDIGEVSVPVVAKATVTKTFPATAHVAQFNPDKVILFVRDPVAVYASLSSKPYANTFGSLDEKVAQFDEDFADFPRDLVVRYEDFVYGDAATLGAIKALGWPCSTGYYTLKRTLADIADFGCRVSAVVRQTFDNGWGFGNITGQTISKAFSLGDYPSELREHVVRLSPRLARYYGYSG